MTDEKPESAPLAADAMKSTAPKPDMPDSKVQSNARKELALVKRDETGVKVVRLNDPQRGLQKRRGSSTLIHPKST